ncbi:hypothetical protein PTKU15_36340 [Paraburkholderia terrae]|nr:hypothetical protein PTKU15_36340 [Paraburkholderia terrae]
MFDPITGYSVRWDADVSVERQGNAGDRSRISLRSLRVARYIERVLCNLGFHALVCGDRVDFFDPCDFEGDAGSWRNGERIAGSLSGDNRTRPFDSLKFLWDEFARQRRMISLGAVVTTGALSVPIDVERTGNFRAQFSDAKVNVTL